MIQLLAVFVTLVILSGSAALLLMGYRAVYAWRWKRYLKSVRRSSGHSADSVVELARTAGARQPLPVYVEPAGVHRVADRLRP
jgi:hypothetical protein